MEKEKEKGRERIADSCTKLKIFVKVHLLDTLF